MELLVSGRRSYLRLALFDSLLAGYFTLLFFAIVTAYVDVLVLDAVVDRLPSFERPASAHCSPPRMIDSCDLIRQFCALQVIKFLVAH